MRVDMRAHVRLRNRLRNMRMLIRIAIPEGLKAAYQQVGQSRGSKMCCRSVGIG
jgi:hypothetical protein